MIYEFRIPEGKLVARPDGWGNPHGDGGFLAGRSAGATGTREAFLQSKSRATHRGLSSSPEDWQPLSLAEHERAMADRRLEMVIDFVQPTDGKATIVIDDAQGRRVRNLISGRPMAPGAHRIVWDGANDDGDAQPPGRYRWRGLSHPGLNPRYLFSFSNGPAPTTALSTPRRATGVMSSWGQRFPRGAMKFPSLSRMADWSRLRADGSRTVPRGVGCRRETPLHRLRRRRAGGKTLTAASRVGLWRTRSAWCGSTWPRATWSIIPPALALACALCRLCGGARLSGQGPLTAGPGGAGPVQGTALPGRQLPQRGAGN